MRRDRLPLAGVRVVITRPHQQSSKLADMLREKGAETVLLPLISICWRVEELLQVLPDLHRYDAIVAASANALRALGAAAKSAGIQLSGRCPECLVVGAATAAAASELGVSAAYPAGGRTADDLAHWLLTDPQFDRPLNLLWLRGQLADDRLGHALAQAGHRVHAVVAYDTVPAPAEGDRWRCALSGTGPVVIALYSPSAVEQLVVNYGDLLAARQDSVFLAAIGPTTAAAVNAAGLPLWCVANSPSDAGLVDALVHTWNRTGEP